MELEVKIFVGQLLDTYGSLLTEHQNSIMEQYYLLDNSFSEIAETENSSRQAIFDCIQKTTSVLKNYEDKLKFLEKKQLVGDGLNQIINSTEDDEIKTIAKNILYKI